MDATDSDCQNFDCPKSKLSLCYSERSLLRPFVRLLWNRVIYFSRIWNTYLLDFYCFLCIVASFFRRKGPLGLKKRTVFAVKIKTKIDFSIKSIKESPLAKRIGINSAYWLSIVNGIPHVILTKLRIARTLGSHTIVWLDEWWNEHSSLLKGVPCTSIIK